MFELKSLVDHLQNPCLLLSGFVKNKLGILMYAFVHFLLRSLSFGGQAGSSFIFSCPATKIRGSPRGLLYGLILYIGGAGILCANRGPQDLFDQGNTGYSQGCYKEAIQAYKATLAYGESPELYFNLEEAYLQEGLISQALLAYERLALLAPYSKLKPAAFEKIRAYYQDPKWSLAQRLARVLPYPNGWSWLVGVSFWGLVTSCLGLWLNRLRSRMFYWFLTLSLGGLVLASIGCWGWQSYRKVGIVLHPAPLKLAPTPQSPYLETLALGTWVHLEKQTEGYAWVVLPHGQKGWLNAEDLERLIAPRADKQPEPQPSL